MQKFPPLPTTKEQGTGSIETDNGSRIQTMSAAPAEKKMEDALSLAARSIAVRAIADSTANGRSFAHHSKLRLNQACSNAVAQDTEPLKALSFTANPLVRSHQERRSNLRSPVRSQTVRSRFERPTLQLTLLGSRPCQQRARCTSHMYMNV